jgi:hypothetical protein
VEKQLREIGDTSVDRHRMRRRFWLEFAFAAVSAAALLLAVLWPHWIEIALRVDPDGGRGSLEWLVFGFIVAIGIACSVLARREWLTSQVEPA